MFNPLSSPHQPLIQPVAEDLELHQVAQEFRLEVGYRDAFERYCEWYSSVAAEHQRELRAIQREANLLRFFQQNAD